MKGMVDLLLGRPLGVVADCRRRRLRLSKTVLGQVEQHIDNPYNDMMDLRVQKPPRELAFWWDDHVGGSSWVGR
jgi:hypothetical protein